MKQTLNILNSSYCLLGLGSCHIACKRSVKMKYRIRSGLHVSLILDIIYLSDIHSHYHGSKNDRERSTKLCSRFITHPCYVHDLHDSH